MKVRLRGQPGSAYGYEREAAELGDRVGMAALARAVYPAPKSTLLTRGRRG